MDHIRFRIEQQTPTFIAVVYCIFGLAWIVLSDAVVAFMTGSMPTLPTAQTAKGAAFVLGTGAFLRWVLLRNSRLVNAAALAQLEARADTAAALEVAIGRAENARSEAEDASRLTMSAHAALAESEARLRSVLASALDAVVTIDADGTVVDWNEEATRTFGWTAEEAIGRELASLIIPEAFRAAHRNALARLRAAGKAAGRRRFELVGLRHDGGHVPVELSIIPVFRGGTVFHTAFIRDISERVAADESARHVAAIVDGSSEAIIGIDPNGTIKSWNRSTLDMYAATGSELEGLDIGALFAAGHEAEAASLRDAVRFRLETNQHRSRHARLDGTEIGVAYSLRPVVDSGGNPLGAALIVRDVSEESRLQERLDVAEHLAGLGRIAATVGHEFNNVLMGIMPFVEVLRRTPAADTRARALQHIQFSVDRGKRITEEILYFTRAITPPAFELMATNRWLEDMGEELQALLAPLVAVDVEDATHGLAIIGDPRKLAQVLTNLALNARDAMPGGGVVTLHLRESKRAAQSTSEDCWIELTLRDTGEGIAADVVPHVFEPLYTTKRRGTGLGLAVVHEIVHRHGGRIEVASTLGEGTAFTIHLRARRFAVTERDSPAKDGSYSPRRLLLVEDDVIVASGLAHGLTQRGMTVDVIHGGAQAEAAVERFTPDVVVLDIGLPDLDGRLVYKRLSNRWPALPVIFSTGHGDEIALAEEIAQPHVGFLRKPYSVETLLEVIAEVSERAGS
jgi:PAS domain S-box-containing protein